jgi:hypothetical protein
VDYVELMAVLRKVFEGVGLVELERVARHWLEVDADYVEAGPVVADRAAASPAEQIQQTRPSHPLTPDA